MPLINSLIQFIAGTKAKANEVNDNFETLRQGHNDHETRIETQTTKLNNLNIVNVKDYGAIGNGITDDTEAIRKAIYAVSPITTDFTGMTLSNFDAGSSDFNNSNAYRQGGTVYLPKGIYKITDTVYLNPYVTLQGDGHQSISDSDTASSKGTIINFQPEVTLNKAAIAICGFDKATGSRWDVTDWRISSSEAISESYGTQIKNLSINCKEGTLIGLKVARATNANISDVSIIGNPITGCHLASSKGGCFNNLSIQATTMGVVITDTQAWNMSGYQYYIQNGTKEALLPFYCSESGDEADQFTSYSTGIYGVNAGEIAFTAPVVKNWNRGVFINTGNWSILNPYCENITNIVFNTDKCAVDIAYPYIISADADVLYSQLADAENIGRQITLRSGFHKDSSYNKLIKGTLSCLSNGVIIDIPAKTILRSTDLTKYEGITFTHWTEKTDIINIYVDYSTGSNTSWGYSTNAPVKSIKQALLLCKKDKLNIINLKKDQIHYTDDYYATATDLRVKIVSWGTSGANAILQSYNASGYGRYILLENSNVTVDGVTLTLTSGISQSDTQGIFCIGAGETSLTILNSTITIPSGLGLVQEAASSNQCGLLNLVISNCVTSGTGYIGVNASGKGMVSGVRYGGSYSISNDFASGWTAMYSKS